MGARVAILGDRGIPARYSGFSTLVEEIAPRLVRDHGMDVTVYCRRHYYDQRPSEHRGVHCVYLPAPGGKSFESIVHSNLAIWHAALLGRFDLAFVVDPGNAPFILPLAACGTPRVMHTDGMGWKRTKWNIIQQAYYKWSERVCAAWSTWLVTDSCVMSRYYLDEYGAPSSFIPYGHQTGEAADLGGLSRFRVEPGRYHLVVARMEPENNVELIVREYQSSRARLPLVVVGGSPYESEYARRVLAMADDRVLCVGAVWEPALLNALYANCYLYLHGHEVGGTNPSLLRAMGAGAACLPIDVAFHRETLGEQVEFFAKQPGDLALRLEALEGDPARVAAIARQARERAATHYRWDAVAAAYAEVFEAVIAASRAGTRFDPGPGFEPYRPWDLPPGGPHLAAADP